MTLKARLDTCIPTKDLMVNTWYRGEGRNSHVGFWDGKNFRTFGLKFGNIVEKWEGHWDDDGPFQPFEQI